MNKNKAEKLVRSMPVLDGSQRSNGEKYTYEEAVIIGEDNGLDFHRDNPADYYFMLNYLHSIYCRIADNIPQLAAYWFYDVTAKDNKTDKLLTGLIL